MRILVTNDDGYDAPGLNVLWRVANEIGEVVVVAPREEQSYMGHRVTTKAPLAIEEYAKNRYHVNGTPADCVRVALRALRLEVDWVLSGVNQGGNLGSDIFTSGTVAAAREAAYLGLPAIALSQYVRGPRMLDWSATGAMAARAIRPLIESQAGAAAGWYWNINFPHPETTEELDALPLIECRPDTNPQDVRFERGEQGFVYCGRYHERPRSEARDVELCFGGAITLSRLSVEHA